MKIGDLGAGSRLAGRPFSSQRANGVNLFDVKYGKHRQATVGSTALMVICSCSHTGMVFDPCVWYAFAVFRRHGKHTRFHLGFVERRVVRQQVSVEFRGLRAREMVRDAPQRSLGLW